MFTCVTDTFLGQAVDDSLTRFLNTLKGGDLRALSAMMIFGTVF